MKGGWVVPEPNQTPFIPQQFLYWQQGEDEKSSSTESLLPALMAPPLLENPESMLPRLKKEIERVMYIMDEESHADLLNDTLTILNWFPEELDPDPGKIYRRRIQRLRKDL